MSKSYLSIRSLSVIFGRDYRFCVSGSQDNGQRLKCRPCQGLHLHSPRSSPGSAAGVRFPAEDLHLVPAPIKEPAVVLVVEGIAGDSENPLLESCEFKFELDLVHRTIVRLVKVSFHAVKILLETAKVGVRMCS